MSIRWGGRYSHEARTHLILTPKVPLYSKSLKDRLSTVTYTDIPFDAPIPVLDSLHLLEDDIEVGLDIDPRLIFGHRWNTDTYRV